MHPLVVGSAVTQTRERLGSKFGKGMAGFPRRTADVPHGCGPALRRASIAMVAIAACGVWTTALRASSQMIMAAPADQVEAGSPSFVILGQEALGLDSPPTDIHLMPDGQVMVLALRQLAFGDGVRWVTRPQASGDAARLGCAVDRDGQIYFGSAGGFSRIQFSETGQWHVEYAAPWPSDEAADRLVPQKAIDVGDEWLWHSDSGSVISWRPGQAARSIGRVQSIGCIFKFHDVDYISDQSNGRLYRVKDGRAEDVFAGENRTIKDTVTAAAPFGKDLVVVGTAGRGVQLFDGHSFRLLRSGGVLASGSRINDLSSLPCGLFAAAVENLGVVFFDGKGRTVQTLDRFLDHRLANVKRLISGQGGSIWGLVDEGVLRVDFPSRVSNFEPLVGVGVASPTVYRMDGERWICSNERLLRGTYTKNGRLTELVADTPDGRDVSSFSTATGRAVAGTDSGAYFRTAAGWAPFAPETKGLRVLSLAPVDGRFLYGAHGEMGWLRPTKTGFDVERIPQPELGHIYNSVNDDAGRIWLELGVGRLGRIEVIRGAPSLEIFGEREGVPHSWTMAFEIDGVVRFNIAGQWLRFNEATRRFVPDGDFVRKIAGLEDCGGRPVRDAMGRLWIKAKGGPQVLEERDGVLHNLNERMPAGLSPWTFIPETGGVVWMVGDRRLARYDPSFPVNPPVPARALITHVTLIESKRDVVPRDGALPALDYSANSLAVHFVAPGRSLAESVSFAVKLDGAHSGWTEVGGSGTAVFNQLKEGHYVLHVVPHAGGTSGTEATLALDIRPPWFRSPLAIALYVVLAAGAFSLSVWLVTYLSRREKLRLERLVEERTSNLRESESRVRAGYELLRSVMEGTTDTIFVKDLAGGYQMINSAGAESLGRPVSEIVGHTDAELFPDDVARDVRANDHHVIKNGQAHTYESSLPKGGMVRTFLTVKAPRRDASGTIIGLVGVARDITARKALEEQLRQAQKMEVIGLLAGGIAHDFNNILTGILGNNEIATADLPADHPVQEPLLNVHKAALRARNLVKQILTFSRQHEQERVAIQMDMLVREAMDLLRPSLPASIEISCVSDGPVPPVLGDSSQLHQIVMNLATNAAHAIGDAAGKIEFHVDVADIDADAVRQKPQLKCGRFVRMTISDTGCGMDAKTIARIYEPFFTTKRPGAGTGLGLSVVHGIVQKHDGFIVVSSELGKGTTFQIYLPVDQSVGPHIGDPDEPAVRQGRGERIMVVDDEDMVVQVASGILKRLNYRATVFTNPFLALRALQEQPSAFDLVVTDLTMPKMNGTELAAEMHRVRPDVAIVLCTGFIGAIDQAELTRLGLRGPLLKPFEFEAMARIIGDTLDATLGVSSAG
jgi:PAS domain S-box-containing protein